MAAPPEPSAKLTVSTMLVRALVETVERVGIPREHLLKGATIDAARLDDLGGRFSLAEFAEFQIHALDRTRDEALGLRIPELSSEAAFSLMAPLVTNAPTVREAVSLCSQFAPLFFDGAQLSAEERGEVVTIRCTIPRSTPRSDRMFAEFAVAGLLYFVRAFAGQAWTPVAALFEHPAPPHRREYTRVFAGTELFAEPVTGLRLGRETFDRPQTYRHPEVYLSLRSAAQRALEEHTAGSSNIADKVRGYLLARPPAHIPELPAVARDLGISPRSLRRRLADDGSSYKAIVQGILETTSSQLLRDPARSIQQVAHAMGFSSAAAFQRAFKRWTGVTPGQYRQRRDP